MSFNYQPLLKLAVEHGPTVYSAVREHVQTRPAFVPAAPARMLITVEDVQMDATDYLRGINAFTPRPKDGHKYILATMTFQNPPESEESASPGVASQRMRFQGGGMLFNVASIDTGESAATGHPEIAPGTEVTLTQAYMVREEVQRGNWVYE